MAYYALRYLPEVALKDRKHAPTVGRWPDFGEADDARQYRVNGHLMEVVVR